MGRDINRKKLNYKKIIRRKHKQRRDNLKRKKQTGLPGKVGIRKAISKKDRMEIED